MNPGNDTEALINNMEKIIASIPGFKGYYQREFRRDSDKLQRQFIMKKLRDTKNRMSVIIKEAAREKRLDLLTDYDEIMTDMERFLNEVTYADSGYSRFFDLITIKKSQLEEIYRFDVALLDHIQELSGKIEILSKDALNKNEVRKVKSNLENITAGFKSRNEILHGFSDR